MSPILILVLAACTTEGGARAALEADGHTDIRLVRDGPNDFRFTSRQGDRSCSGHYTPSNFTSFCAAAPCLPESPEVCVERADAWLGRVPMQALHAAQIACAAGNGDGCNRVTLWPMEGKVPAIGDTMVWADKSCKLPNYMGCANRGFLKQQAGDLAGARADFELACSNGDGLGCGNLGVSYSKGLGVPVDHPKATELYEKACSYGSEANCMVAGIRFARGVGVPPDGARALDLFERACRAEVPNACRAMHSEVAYGRVPGDAGAAIEAMILACERGDGGSCTEVGFFHEKGIGTRQNPRRARELYQTACAVEHGLGCHNLAVTQEKGLGGPREAAGAQANYAKACQLGFQPACP